MTTRLRLHATLATLGLLAGCSATIDGPATGDQDDLPVVSAPPGATAGAVETLDDTDRQAFAIVRRASKVGASAADRIWREEETGAAYDFSKTPLYLVRRSATIVNERAYVVHHPSPVGAPVTSDAFAELGQVFRYDEKKDVIGDANFSFGEDIGGASTFVFPYRPANDPPTEDDAWDPSIPASDQFFGYLVHEAFHRFQIEEDRWQDYEGWTQDEASYPLVRENIALALLENEVLAAGLAATESAEKVAALEQLVAIRKARIAAPWAVVSGVNFVEKLDLPQEHGEGTASYAELRFREAAGELNGGVVGESRRQLLRAADVASYATQSDVRIELAFGRFYASGAAIGFLLDDVGGVDWRSACKRAIGAYDSAAAKYPGVAGAEADAKLAAAKSAHAYESKLLAAADALLALPEGEPMQWAAAPKGSPPPAKHAKLHAAHVARVSHR